MGVPASSTLVTRPDPLSYLGIRSSLVEYLPYIRPWVFVALSLVTSAPSLTAEHCQDGPKPRQQWAGPPGTVTACQERRVPLRYSTIAIAIVAIPQCTDRPSCNRFPARYASTHLDPSCPSLHHRRLVELVE